MTRYINNEKPLGEIIAEFLEHRGMTKKLDETRVIESWRQVVGNLIANHTENIYMKHSVLYIVLDSAVIKQEVSYAKQTLIKTLNDTAGKRIVSDIFIL